MMVFFHYCVVSNYFWLFIEGLYLFTLLVETFFPERRYFYWYIIIGWGRSLAVAQTGSGLMARDVLGPAIRERQVRREALPCLAADDTLPVLGSFLALLVESPLSDGGNMLKSPPERRGSTGFGGDMDPQEAWV